MRHGGHTGHGEPHQGARGHAVVLGGSMAGLLAARVLSDHFEQVTVVERDLLPEPGGDRRGVPQGRHVHGLLPAGSDLVERFFPGLVSDLVAEGAPVLRDLERLHLRLLGRLLCQQSLPLQPTLQVSRPVLEARIRSRVAALPGVRIRDGRAVVGLVASPRRDRITGVKLMDPEAGDGVTELLCADLVVDAMGRAGRTPAWLEAFGYERPPVQELRVDVTYASRRIRLQPGAVEHDLVLVGPEPGRLTGMGLFAYEDDTWVFTTFGYGESRPRADMGAMLTLAEDIAPPHVVAAIRSAEPLSDISVHGFPCSRRRHYERLHRFPQGLLVIGDSLCSFNPIYGQGMTVAAAEAGALDDALAEGDAGLAQRFFRAAAAPVDVAWQFSVGSDLALPEVAGERPRRVRAVNAWVAGVLSAAQHDPTLAYRFLRVTGFLDPPSALFRPHVVRGVLRPRVRSLTIPARQRGGVLTSTE